MNCWRDTQGTEIDTIGGHVKSVQHIPCRCLNVWVEWHFHTTVFYGQTQGLSPKQSLDNAIICFSFFLPLPHHWTRWSPAKLWLTGPARSRRRTVISLGGYSEEGSKFYQNDAMQITYLVCNALQEALPVSKSFSRQADPLPCPCAG